MKRLLHFLRLRYLALALLIWFLATQLDVQERFSSPILARIDKAFESIGYPNATYKVKKLTLSKLILEDIVLDFDETTRDPISAIERIEADYSALGFFIGRFNNVIMTHPDLFYSADAFPRLPNLGEGFSSFPTIPAQSIEIRDLNMSYAGEEFNPSVSGSFLLNTDENNLKRLLINLKGKQKDFSVDLKITASADPSGLQHINIDLPELRIDIPKVFMISRTHGRMNLDYQSGHLTGADGEFVAGAARVSKVPFDNISFVLKGQENNIRLLGNAAVTGVPMTNISLRLTEDKNGAQGLLQFSGEQPQELARIFGSGLTLPKQQKFSFAVDLKNKNIQKLVSFPLSGGLFFYGEQSKSLLKATLNCSSLTKGCEIDLPTTPVPLSAFNAFAGPELADRGLVISSGHLWLGAKIKNLFGPGSSHINFEAGLRDGTLTWQGLKMTNAAVNILSKNLQDWTVAGLNANALNGTIRADSINLSKASSKNDSAISFENINLSDLSDLMRTRGLSMSGLASGRLLFSLADGVFSLKKGSTVEAKKGEIQYLPKTWPAFLSGPAAPLKTLREVLKSYDFETARLDLEGPSDEKMAATLSATGKSPNLFGDRPLQVEIKMRGPLAPGLVRLIPESPAK